MICGTEKKNVTMQKRSAREFVLVPDTHCSEFDRSKGSVFMADTLFDRFAQYGKRRVAEKGEIIHDPSSEKMSHQVIFLESGLASLMSYTKDGEERVYLYFRGKRLIGFAPVLNQMVEYYVTMNRSLEDLENASDYLQVAKSRCVLYEMSEADFKHLLDTDLSFNRLVLSALASNYIELMAHFRQSLEESAGTRFCRLLLEAYMIRDGKKVLPKSLTFLEMSKYLGTHPVTVSRIVAILKKEGCIAKIDGRVTILDENRLRYYIKENIDIK